MSVFRPARSTMAIFDRLLASQSKNSIIYIVQQRKYIYSFRAIITKQLESQYSDAIFIYRLNTCNDWWYENFLVFNKSSAKFYSTLWLSRSIFWFFFIKKSFRKTWKCVWKVLFALNCISFITVGKVYKLSFLSYIYRKFHPICTVARVHPQLTKSIVRYFMGCSFVESQTCFKIVSVLSFCIFLSFF